jgi:hypothetical protein
MNAERVASGSDFGSFYHHLLKRLIIRDLPSNANGAKGWFDHQSGPENNAVRTRLARGNTQRE